MSLPRLFVQVLFGILLLPFPGFFTVSGGASSQSDSTPKNACEPILTSFLLEDNGRIPTLDSFKHLAWQPPSSTDTAGADALFKHHFDRLLVLFGILLLPFPGFFTVSGGASSQSDSTPKNACEPILTSFLLEDNGRIPTLDSFKHLAWQPPSSTDTAGGGCAI
ncbi:hypothetical protein MTO96_031481 [Rhipicephalus appendiculatus]